ncbi:MAG TPA: hypothetical protein VF469_08100 [Kofleriaceae bacterium]
MTQSRWLSTLFLSSTLFATACMATSDDADATDPADDGTAVHLMPMHDSTRESQAAPPGAHLTFFGGPVLKNVSVHPVFWNANTQFRTNINAFYNAVTKSALFDMLSQYSAIGRGSGVAGFVDNRTSTRVSDAAIHTELNRLFAAGSLPPPTANNYYPVHFPAGVSITAPDGSRSCVTFCAYHGTYVRNGVNVNYGVIPDQGGSCAGGCGNNAQRVNNMDSVASHELIEAVTDPAVGLATVFGPPLAWYDMTNGEIGDICNGQQGTTVGGDGVTYTIQLEFSNRASNCVAR